MNAGVVILSGAGCTGKTDIAVALKVHHAFARVSVWTMRLQHLVLWEDRDHGDDYEPGWQIAEAACGIYSARGKRSVMEDVGDAEAVALIERFRQRGIPAILVSLVADPLLIAERLAKRDCKPTELPWLVGLDTAIRARQVLPFETRFEAREWLGRAEQLAQAVTELLAGARQAAA